jgi:hypothetical protein
MKESRARLKSGSETVQTIRLDISKNAYNNIQAQTATFKWQGTTQCYADITGPMSMTRAFILGCDGQSCWIYSESDKGEKRLDRTPVAQTKLGILVVDPFELAQRSVEQALAEAEFVYASDAELEGRTCCRLEKWDVSGEGMAFATQTRWWIDKETFLLKQIVQYRPHGCEIVHFDYKDLNQPIPDSAFQPPVVADQEAKPLFFKGEPDPGQQRFFHVSDGSNGRMSGRIGFRGPNGTTSSGLN